MKSRGKNNSVFSESIESVSFRAEWPNFLIVAIFVVALMAPFTLGGKALMPDTWKSIHPWARGLDPYDNQASIYDTVLEYEPWFIYSQQCLKEGRVPHWNPWQFCGAPLYANRLVPFFFPPFILAEIISQPSKILGWFQLFNLIISGWGMYFLLRGWRLMPSVSTLSSCLYLTCGFHFLPFPLWTLGTIGFPWLLWVLDGFLKKPGLKPIATSGFIAGMILMVGYPVLVVHLSYFTVMYFIARWWATRRTGSGRLHWSIPPLVLAAIFIIGFGISAIANVPAQHYSRQTVRHVEGFTDKAFEYEKRKLLATKEETGLDVITERFGERADILLPINGRGTQRAWQYAGVLVYLLAFLGILSGRPRARLLAILGLIFAIIVWIPEIYIALLDYLPGWALTILLPIHVVNLTACLLAAFGIESLFSEKWKPDTIGKIIFLILTIAGITLTFNMLRNAPIVDVPIADIIREKNLLATSPFHLYYLVALTVISCAIAALIFIRSKILFARYFVVITSIIFSLSVHFYQQPVYSDSNYQPSTPFTEFVEKNIASPDDGKFNGRIARWAELAIPFNPHRRAKSPFTPNIHLKWGLYDVGGYDSLVPKRYIDYHSLFEEAIMEYRALAAYRAPDTMRHKRFRDMAVRWIITQGELPPEGREGLSLIWDDRFQSDVSGTDAPDDFMQVWEVANPQPRVFLTRRVAFASDPSDNPLVQAANWNVKGIDVVIVEDPSGENRTFAFPDAFETDEPFYLPEGNIEIIKEEPENLILIYNALKECYIILRDGWFPEWRAYIDGEETEIFPADMAFRAVRVPSGEHRVEFRYEPASFITGSRITILTLILCVLMIFFGNKRLFNKLINRQGS